MSSANFTPLGGGVFRVHDETVDVMARTCSCGEPWPCEHVSTARYVMAHGALPPAMARAPRRMTREEAARRLARNVDLLRGPTAAADSFFG